MGDCEGLNFSDTGRLTATGALPKLVLPPTPQFWHSGRSNPPKNLSMGETPAPHTYSSCYLIKCIGAQLWRFVIIDWLANVKLSWEKYDNIFFVT